MENSTKICSTEALPLCKDSKLDTNKEEKKIGIYEEEVIFHSERINEIAGDLVDTTI